MPALRDLGVVNVDIPADASLVHVLRAVAASVGARLPMSLDDIVTTYTEIILRQLGVRTDVTSVASPVAS